MPVLVSDLVENVAYNDENIENAVYTIQIQPTKGSATIEPNGEFRYTPSIYECGTDQFVYQVCNTLTSCCATATVTLNLTDTICTNFKEYTCKYNHEL